MFLREKDLPDIEWVECCLNSSNADLFKTDQNDFGYRYRVNPNCERGFLFVVLGQGLIGVYANDKY